MLPNILLAISGVCSVLGFHPRISAVAFQGISTAVSPGVSFRRFPGI